MTKTRKLEAFLVHVLISVAIFIALYLYIKYELYPGKLFDIDGGKQGLIIVALVDLVLGPLLTLIIYKKGKRGLTRDLWLIGTIQLSCLGAGMYITVGERPLAVILSYDGFHSVGTSSLELYGKDKDMYSRWPGDTPKWLYVQLPNDPKERMKLQLSQMTSGPLYMQDDLLFALDDKNIDPAIYATKLNAIIRIYPNMAENIKQIDEKLNKSGDGFSYIPLIGKYGQRYVILDNTRREIIGALPTDQCKE